MFFKWNLIFYNEVISNQIDKFKDLKVDFIFVDSFLRHDTTLKLDVKCWKNLELYMFTTCIWTKTSKASHD